MIKKVFYQTSTYYYILFVLVLLYNIFLLNKGIGIDEGWYLSLIKDQPDSIGGTQFYKLINFFETNNIILNRFIFLIVDLLSVYVFSFGLRIFLLKKEIIDKAISLSLIFSICYLSGFLLTIPVSFTFYSVTMNKIILCISSGFLLTHLFSDENKNTSILLYFSGFFLGVQFFSMITTITIWLLFSVLIIFTSKKQKLDLLYFISGITSVIILYFLSIQPFDDFWQKEILATVSSVLKNKQDSHSTGYLIQWIVNSFIYIFFLIILPTILSIVLSKVGKDVLNSLTAVCLSFLSCT